MATVTRVTGLRRLHSTGAHAGKNRAITSCGGYGTHADADFSKSQNRQRWRLLRGSAGSCKCALSASDFFKWLLAAVPEGDQVQGLSHLRWWHVYTKYSPNAVGEGP